MQWKNVQPVIQVRAESILVNHRFQVAIVCGNEANVRSDGTIAANSLEFLVLDRAQQLRLEFERHLPDFIEKKRALVGQFESSDSLRQGSRKRPLLMSEQLAFEQARGNRGAVHFDEAAFFPTAQLMDCSGDEFLSRSGFPLDEDSRIGGRDDLKALYDR